MPQALGAEFNSMLEFGPAAHRMNAPDGSCQYLKISLVFKIWRVTTLALINRKVIVLMLEQTL